MRKNRIIILLFWLCYFNLNGQYSSKVWCFGDSVLIDFNFVPPVTGFSSTVSQTISNSLTDLSGNLLMYATSGERQLQLSGSTFSGRVFNKMHQIMQNGDSIASDGGEGCMLTLPMDYQSSIVYLFHRLYNSGSFTRGKYYSVIDLSANGGNGAVITKNILLEAQFENTISTAVRHANGRDWWLVSRVNNFSMLLPDKFQVYLFTPNNVIYQGIQTFSNSPSQNETISTFNKKGTKIACAGFHGKLCLYDFDRCSGLFSNPNLIRPEPANVIWYIQAIQFSPNDSLLYTNEYNLSTGESRVIQFDLYAPNILSTTYIVDSMTVFATGYLDMALTPDNRIFINTPIGYPFPYNDTLRSQFTDSLSVINYPNVYGAGCNFVRSGFPLGGRTACANSVLNPNYELGRLLGSPCDSLTYVNEIKENTNGIIVSPNPFVNSFTLNAPSLNKQPVVIKNILGQVVFENYIKKNDHVQIEINPGEIAPGIYIIEITDMEGNLKTGKIVKQ